MPPSLRQRVEFVNALDQLHGNVTLHTVLLSVVVFAAAMQQYSYSCITRFSIGIDDCKCPFQCRNV